MMFKTHEAGGLVACTVAFPLLVENGVVDNSVISAACFFFGGFIGSALPDIDSPTSKVSRGIRKVFTGNARSDKHIINHRRLPHMPLFWIFILGLCLLVSDITIFNILLYGLAFGIGSHLLLDCLNPAGIPILGPINKKRFKLAKIKTNSIGENVIFVLLILVEIYLLFVKTNYIEKILALFNI